MSAPLSYLPAPGPLDDPDYVPAHPPVGGRIPSVVRRWGPASQVRWFHRFSGQVVARPSEVEDMHVHSLLHTGTCCPSCEEDYEYGLDDQICCCRAPWRSLP